MIFLPLIGYTPAMPSHTTIAIVYVDTSADRWQGDIQPTIDQALAWWQARTGIMLDYTEDHMTVTADVNALNVCRDRQWLPNTQADMTLYVVAWQPTERALMCDGVNVADYTLPGMGIVWGGIWPEEMAHTIGHLYGAADETAPGIMNAQTLRQSYRDGAVSDQTIEAIGL